MADPYNGTQPANGVNHQPLSSSSEEENNTKPKRRELKDEESLYCAFMALISPIFFPHRNSNGNGNGDLSLFHRIRESLKENLPRVNEAVKSSGFRLLRWARGGSSLRLLLLVSVGSIALLTLTGVIVSLFFVAAATINAIIISLFMSLAAAGGFLAMFFACVAVIYVGALSVAIFVIVSTLISAVITVLIVTGWIGFFWTVWLALRKSAYVAKHSAGVTGSALSAYTSAWHAHRHNHHD